MIYDTFEEMLFAGSELGHNILGRKSSLARFSGESIREFVARTHTTDQMVFSSIGNLSAKSVETTVARYLNDIKSSARDFSRRQPAAVEPFSRIVTKHTHQTHCIIGARAQGINDAERLPLALLVNLLGGPSANSLLNVLVREKNGLSYNIEASYTPYSDSGIVAIYFSCDHDNTDHCIELIEGELGRLQTTPLSARRLSMAKKQFIAQLAISMESNEGYMLGAGKSFLAHREVDTMEEVYRKIQALTAEDLTAVASSVFSSPSRLIYKITVFQRPDTQLYIMDALERYIHDFSSPEEELLHELDRQTHLQVVQPRMLSGHIQGKLLELLVRMLRPRNILEIGTFTGYSALCMAAGLEEDGVLTRWRWTTSWRSSPPRFSAAARTDKKSVSISVRHSISSRHSDIRSTSYSSTATSANTQTTTGC